MNEPKDLIRWTLTFLNWSIYKWDIMPIDGEFKWIIELRDGSYYPVIFIFSKWECTDFNLIDDHDLSTMLNRWYNPVFWIKFEPLTEQENCKLVTELNKDTSSLTISAAKALCDIKKIAKRHINIPFTKLFIYYGSLN